MRRDSTGALSAATWAKPTLSVARLLLSQEMKSPASVPWSQRHGNSDLVAEARVVPVAGHRHLGPGGMYSAQHDDDTPSATKSPTSSRIAPEIAKFGMRHRA